MKGCFPSDLPALDVPCLFTINSNRVNKSEDINIIRSLRSFFDMQVCTL